MAEQVHLVWLRASLVTGAAEGATPLLAVVDPVQAGRAAGRVERMTVRLTPLARALENHSGLWRPDAQQLFDAELRRRMDAERRRWLTRRGVADPVAQAILISCTLYDRTWVTVEPLDLRP